MELAATLRAQLRPQSEEGILEASTNMEAFLREVETRAFRIAVVSTRDADEALDIVQDAMISLTRRYADRSIEEWRPLFYRILKNRIRDWQRRSIVRGRVMSFFGGQESEEYDPIAQAPGPSSENPIEALERSDAMDALEKALGELPARQREAFTLRNFEGLNVAETAAAMGCSDGSVKTHYSRAVHRLRDMLGEHF
jgi:RNA polymerase sigma-70 factor (ECF subfamily)